MQQTDYVTLDHQLDTWTAAATQLDDSALQQLIYKLLAARERLQAEQRTRQEHRQIGEQAARLWRKRPAPGEEL